MASDTPAAFTSGRKLEEEDRSGVEEGLGVPLEAFFFIRPSRAFNFSSVEVLTIGADLGGDGGLSMTVVDSEMVTRL